MTSDDLFTAAKKSEKKAAVKTAAASASPPTVSNVPEMSVAELAGSLKKTLEQTFSHIRVRGELSGVKIAASGHLYGDIKDVDANINIVCWRGVLSKMDLTPEDGMDVIVTGRVSSYPKSSRYQIIIEKIELAGEGALLKMLEERRKKLAAEGLFDEGRKKPLPFIPRQIGVVTSPSGAVIRDIMHRLAERFPRPVLLWPVNVQGKGAEEQIVSAIQGFNALKNDGTTLPRPDLLIIARGGGSLEDLMAFNAEEVVRAVAECRIPVIAAVGHETDTTLIDYAADIRAPTPTGAAEIAVPVRAQLMAQLHDDQNRLMNAGMRLIEDGKNRLAAQTGRLAHPRQILENRAQNIDYLGEKLTNALSVKIQGQHRNLLRVAGQLTSPQNLIAQKRQALSYTETQLKKTAPALMENAQNKLAATTRILHSLSYKNVLSRGYALIRDKENDIIRASDSVVVGAAITIEFDGEDVIHAGITKTLKD